MTISSAFTIDGAANPARHTTTYGATVNFALVNPAGADTITWSVESTSDSGDTLPTITASGTPTGATASLTMLADPGDGMGRTLHIKCVVTAQYETSTSYGVVGVLNDAGFLPVAAGEQLARDGTHGWLDELNNALNSATPTALGYSVLAKPDTGTGAVSSVAFAADSVLARVDSDDVAAVSTATYMQSLPTGTMVCIGGGTAAASFHAFGTNPALRLEEVTGSYGLLENFSDVESRLRHFTSAGTSTLSLSPESNDGTSSAQVRLFRSTNTSGECRLTILRGNDSTDENHRLTGFGDTDLNKLAGDLNVGVAGTNNASIVAAGNVTGANRTANGGNARNSLAPNATAHVNAQGAGSTNYDIALPEDGYYIFSVLVVVQMATALTYHRVGATIDGSRASGTLATEGSQQPINGGDGTGLTLTLSATSGSLRCALNNATGETVNGHINVYWGLTDLPS